MRWRLSVRATLAKRRSSPPPFRKRPRSVTEPRNYAPVRLRIFRRALRYVPRMKKRSRRLAARSGSIAVVRNDPEALAVGQNGRGLNGSGRENQDPLLGGQPRENTRQPAIRGGADTEPSRRGRVLRGVSGHPPQGTESSTGGLPTLTMTTLPPPSCTSSAYTRRCRFGNLLTTRSREQFVSHTAEVSRSRRPS
jgi:hypothetical protein